MNEAIQKLKKIVDESDNIVFFGGAGVSTESGIPDFRSVDGLYNQQYKYPPETILSHTFFMRHPEEYYEFHRAKLCVDGVKPNRAHLKLAELEEESTRNSSSKFLNSSDMVHSPVYRNRDRLHVTPGRLFS